MFGCGKSKRSENESDHQSQVDIFELRDKAFDRVNELTESLTDSIEGSFPWISAMSSPLFAGKEGLSNLWSYPVPSARQYDKCIESGGESAWNQDGVWRCLFPNRQQDSADSGSGSGNGRDQWFSEYNGFLSWRRQMRLAEAQKQQQLQLEAEQRQQQQQQHLETERRQQADAERQGSLWKGWSQDRQNQGRFISESEADGKTVVSSSYSYEVVTNDNGQTETKKKVQKWYDDGTQSLKETVDNGSKGGWFWK